MALRPRLRRDITEDMPDRGGASGDDNSRRIPVYLINKPQTFREVRILQKERLRRGGAGLNEGASDSSV